MTYLKDLFSTKKTPQSEPIPGAGHAPNSAGGYAWPVDDWTRLDRFLVLGSEGGSYYASERKLTLENAQAVIRCLQADGARAVARIVEISESGRAPKADPAIFALALATTERASADARKAALDALPRVCRTGTHLFHFAGYVDGLRGWGRGLRRAVTEWYGMPAEKLAYQAVKYQSRDGWSHRDLLRLSHAKVPADSAHQLVYEWIVKGWESASEAPHPVPELRLVWAFERAKRAETRAEVVRLIREHRLPREAVPTQWLTEAEVWEAVLEEMPMTALSRSLATMTRVGLIAPNSAGTRRVVEQLGDGDRLLKARVHPIAVLAALKTYAQGHGERGKNTWTPGQPVVDALDAAFYASFGSVRRTGKRWLLALDVSGSMDCGTVAGVPGLTPRVASAAMALITAATEQAHTFVGFTAGRGGFGGQWGGGDPGVTEIPISPRKRLDSIVKQVAALPMGGTDCALPMLWAMKRKVEADVFVIYTDSETWAGAIHPAQALRQYRERMGIPAKLVVVGMVSNGFSIADPEDGGMLDVVGFDTAAPNLVSDFATAE